MVRKPGRNPDKQGSVGTLRVVTYRLLKSPETQKDAAPSVCGEGAHQRQRRGDRQDRSEDWASPVYFTSPPLRARRACELAGFGAEAEVETTWSNGTTANTRVFARRRSMPNVLPGSYSAMAAREANRPARLERGLIAWLGAC